MLQFFFTLRHSVGSELQNQTILNYQTKCLARLSFRWGLQDIQKINKHFHQFPGFLWLWIWHQRRRFVATLEENLQGLLLDKNLYRRKNNSICQYPSFYFFFGARCVIEILGIGRAAAGMCAQIAVLTNWVISQHVPFLTLSYFTDWLLDTKGSKWLLTDHTI